VYEKTGTLTFALSLKGTKAEVNEKFRENYASIPCPDAGNYFH
jgi:hypothetical protein